MSEKVAAVKLWTLSGESLIVVRTKGLPHSGMSEFSVTTKDRGRTCHPTQRRVRAQPWLRTEVKF
jgi:hypothetical protein